ncbi:serine protease gd isoform X2 [Solenopsis invicta]|uniref:serine protease gd isoform X2 n=1 Tax=Solenopsis invicta TaxID=13686 RepID=UPI00193E30AE|nr:serine protease gd isoform X2 [Solenopsis invicta]
MIKVQDKYVLVECSKYFDLVDIFLTKRVFFNTKRQIFKKSVTDPHEMAKLCILIALLQLLCTLVQEQKSPCPQYFTFISKPGTDEVMGQIEIPSPSKTGDLQLKIAFQMNVKLPSEYVGHLELARSLEESAQAVYEDKNLLYYVHFPLRHVIPTVTGIWFNDQQYCSDHKATEDIVNTIKLEHTLTLPDTIPRRYTLSPQIPSPTVWSQTSRPTPSPQTPRPTSISQPTTRKITTNVTLSPRINQNPFLTKRIPAPNSNYECGRSEHPKYLVVNGDKISPGQWPWLVALFVANKRIEFDYRCGGSILTNQHILTAAHCLKLDLNSNDTFPPNVLIVALGRFNLTHWREKESTTREVANYTIHPDYAYYYNSDSDLAILKLRDTDYNDYIKPICLWSGATNLEHIIDQMGYVVGWGFDEDNYRFTDVLRLAKLKIVSRMDCLKNDRSFYYFTSDRTFCAGLSGSTLSYGDSGSGLMIFNYALQRYHLRGVASQRISSGPIGTYESTKFTIFADVAMYLPWIQQQIYPYKTTDVQTTKEIERIVYSSGENSITQESSPNFPIFESNISLLNPVSFNDTDCGKPFQLNIVNPLTYHGFLTQPGEWPWLAAIFVTNTLEENFQFQCGGSVLTTKHVITAAHCLKINMDSNETWPPYALLVALGRFNLTHRRERGSLYQEVANYVIHPDYTHSLSGDSDLAILIFRRPIKYGNSIRPICLWPNNLTDIQHVVNRLGYVVGWGEDETGRRNTDDPRMVRVPIVKQETCLRSDTTFASLTSERTFCAGWLNETGPCNGDSGSGLAIYDDTSRRFLLRGIVSRSMLNTARLCDFTKYFVSVDVAKYISWILVQISN